MGFTLSEEFPNEVRELLITELTKGPKIEAAIVDKVIKLMDIEVGRLMIQLLPTAANYARTPVSHFNVGAVALGMPPGSLYLGSNMEFQGQALSFCVHGEQSATNHAWLSGETGLQAIAVNAAPCGYCRQFLYEISTATKGFQVMLKKYPKQPTNYDYTQHPLTYYLPDAFGPGDLKDKHGRLMNKEDHGLTISSSDGVAQAALKAANASYAQYSYDYSGVALKLKNGNIYAGRYAENAAYNPSMSPMESALAIMSMSEKPQAPYEIIKAVLVEAKNPNISQKDATKDVLASVAPKVSLEHFWAT